jgi:hypothetical protein
MKANSPVGVKAVELLPFGALLIMGRRASQACAETDGTACPVL